MEQQVTKTRMVVITGSPAVGKTALLERFLKAQQNNYRMTGVLTHAKSARNFRGGKGALSYEMEFFPSGKKLIWAKRDASGVGFHFAEENLASYLLDFHWPVGEIAFLDNVGQLEVQERGLAPLLNVALEKPLQILIISVQKRDWEHVREHFKLSHAELIDLDQIDPEKGFQKLMDLVELSFAERVGLFGAMSAGVEVGVGSLLHSLHVPLRGTVLSYLQAFLLTLYGKELKGKGLLQISFIASALKSFSPAGAKLKPMLYISLQGLCYAFPTFIIGWNFFSVLLGTLLLALFNLFGPLAIDFFIFGPSVIKAYLEVATRFGDWIGFPMTLWSFLMGVALIKGVIAIALSLCAYYGAFGKFLEQNRRKLELPTEREGKIEIPVGSSWRDSFVGALQDLKMKWVFIPFIFISLLIFFFAHLSTAEFIIVVIRGIILTWFGFVLARRVHFGKIIAMLHRYHFENMALGLERALILSQTFLPTFSKKSRES